ncbi:histidine kinase [Gloeocapsopsis sp. IPPAS B-1203]|nr:histidine kinase [Gloeocapsopsis sp. IPPAS B-1203]
MRMATTEHVILIVDDTPANLEVLFSFLTDCGFKILIAEDGESALQKAEYALPELILLDIVMPGIDGFETCRRLKAQAATRDIPVIFMTALSETVDKVRGLQVGAVDYITKPLQHEEVLARVQTHLRLRNLNKQLQAQNLQLEQEIKQRQQQEEALRQSEERFRLAIEGVKDYAIFMLDAEGCIVSWNTGAERIKGYQAAEIIGRHFSCFYPEADWQSGKPQQLLQIAAQEGQVKDEGWRVRKDGSRFWADVAIAALRDEKGLRGFSKVTRDITERKRAEEELQRQYQRSQLFAEVTLKIRQSLQIGEVLQTAVTEVQKILHADRVLIYRFWSDGTGSSVAEAVLPGWVAILGQKFPEEVFPEDYRQLYLQGRICRIPDIEKEENISPCLVEFVRQFSVKAKLVVPIIIKQELWGLLIAHQCANSRYWTNFETELLRQLADQIGIALTQAQLLEQETRFSQQLARSNAELQQFASIASHDLQEPLRKIQAFGNRLQDKYRDVLNEQGRDYIQRMQNAAHRMQTLIDDLLIFSRLTTRAQPLVSVVLAEVITEVLSDLEVLIQQTGGRVDVSELPTISADPLQMRQLFQNLIGNALKFRRANEPPCVKISSQIIEQPQLIADSGGAELCQIAVEDNGIGFDAKYLDRIFQVFQRLHNRSEYEGTGMGLAICRKIVERHRGTLTAESQPGQGARFIITLPVNQLSLDK